MFSKNMKVLNGLLMVCKSCVWDKAFSKSNYSILKRRVSPEWFKCLSCFFACWFDIFVGISIAGFVTYVF